MYSKVGGTGIFPPSSVSISSISPVILSGSSVVFSTLFSILF